MNASEEYGMDLSALGEGMGLKAVEKVRLGKGLVSYLCVQTKTAIHIGDFTAVGGLETRVLKHVKDIKGSLALLDVGKYLVFRRNENALMLLNPGNKDEAPLFMDSSSMIVSIQDAI
jgi:hypothetical protein